MALVNGGVDNQNPETVSNWEGNFDAQALCFCRSIPDRRLGHIIRIGFFQAECIARNQGALS